MLAAGLASGDRAELGKAVLECWDAFLDVVTDPRTDLSRPSRLPGWTGADLCAHLGTWDGVSSLDVIASSARAGTAEGLTTAQVDADNARVIAAHADGDVVQALRDSRTAVSGLIDSGDLDELALTPASSPLGALPLLTVLHAGCFELAVHALDLAPCGAPEPPEVLLDRGLAALIDVTGGLAATHGIRTRLTAQSDERGWTFTADDDGWTTVRCAGDRCGGATIRGEAAAILDAAAGRSNPVQQVLRRTLKVSDLPAFVSLAPLLDAAPGLPGGRALKAAAGGVGKLGKLLRRR